MQDHTIAETVYKIVISTILVCGITVLGVEPQEPALAPRPIIKVMSFNIRYGTANDGTNSWAYRAHLVIEAIRGCDPDLLGLQEVLAFQAEWIKKMLSEYYFHGVGRDDGDQKGEMVPVMFKTNRFELVNKGHFWLSEQPERPGSRSWDSSVPRMVSWVILRDLKTGASLLFVNTHLDHQGRLARAASAKLIREKVSNIGAGIPIIITGDFNCGPEDEPYRILVLGKGFSVAQPQWIDSYREIYPKPSAWEATFHGWQGKRDGLRIDWIIHSADFITLDARIVYYQDGGRLPSDHYPVWAVLRFR